MQYCSSIYEVYSSKRVNKMSLKQGIGMTHFRQSDMREAVSGQVCLSAEINWK